MQEPQSCGTVMLRRGNELTAPNFKDLSVNTDDDSVVALLSRLLGIRENRTDVAIGHSRESFEANIKHTFYYLFQKQGLVANKDQLFYRQNEAFQPQAIRDTLPILLGISSNDRYELEAKLRTAQRDLKINAKRLEQARDTIDTSLLKGSGLLSEARAVGIITQDKERIGTDEVIDVLRSAMQWIPSPYLKTMDIEYPFLKMKLLVYDKTDVRPSPELILLGCMPSNQVILKTKF